MFADTKALSGFAVRDLDRARAFYEDTLGLRTTVQSDDFMTLHLAGGGDTIVYQQPNATPASYTMLNFVVDDVEKAVDELAARGIELQRYEGFDQDEKGISRGEGPIIAWFEDPDGNVLSVFQE